MGCGEGSFVDVKADGMRDGMKFEVRMNGLETYGGVGIAERPTVFGQPLATLRQRNLYSLLLVFDDHFAPTIV